MESKIKLVTDVKTGDAIAIYPECQTHYGILYDIACNGYALVQLIIAPADGIICEYQVKEVPMHDNKH